MGKLVSAAKKGKKRDMLVALRDEIAEQIEDMDAAASQTANPLQAARKAVADGD